MSSFNVLVTLGYFKTIFSLKKSVSIIKFSSFSVPNFTFLINGYNFLNNFSLISLLFLNSIKSIKSLSDNK